ncbi:MAG: IS110 family transposase [Spirochaetes bacterium]|nr:IS110 family transposase [Spirochaetota bacterium]
MLGHIIDVGEEKVKEIEEKIEALVEGDTVGELLQTIPGCRRITAWTIRAYTDDIRRFPKTQHYASFVGVVPYNI